MRVCIHRGSKEIGGSCVEVESQGQRLLIDFGLPLEAKEDKSRYLPAISGLDGKDSSLLGILISHPHLDHYGLLAHVSPEIPVGMGAAARRVLAAAHPFMSCNWQIPHRGWSYQSERSFDVGPFRITPLLVDHSAYDAYAFLIESEGKKIFYSGDFRSHGRKSALFERLIAKTPKDIDALLLEGSSLGRLASDQRFQTEKEIESELARVLSSTDGLALVHTSGQNIDRIVSIYRASIKTGRKLVIDLYTAAVLEATENNNIPQSAWPDVVLFIPHAQRIMIKKNAWFSLLDRHSVNRIYIENLSDAPQKSTLLFRPLHMRDLEIGKCLAGAAYIYSQWDGYWEQGSYDRVKNWIELHSVPKMSIHTSGHASVIDLKRFAAAINPLKIIPIHSFLPNLYFEIFQNVEMHDDGEWWEV